jgi:hypothetical protein
MASEITGATQTSHSAVQILRDPRCGCFGLSRSARRMIYLIDDLKDITPFQKHALINRYTGLTETLRRRTCIYAAIFHIGRTIVTVGSLIVPALLSIQYTNTGGSTNANPTNMPYLVYWTTWIISLLVTTCNGILTLFKVDKKYFFLHTTLEQIKSEAWQYIHLSGKYGGFYSNGALPTHENQYVYFCHNIEKIKLRQVEEEYYKLTESSSTQTATKTMDVLTNQVPDSKIIAGLYTPTPAQNELIRTEQELVKALSQARVDGASSDAQRTASPPKNPSREKEQKQEQEKEQPYQQPPERWSRSISRSRDTTAPTMSV